MVKEIFDMGQQINVEGAVYVFLPIVLKKSSNDLGHIKEMSQQILISLSANCGYDISFRSKYSIIKCQLNFVWIKHPQLLSYL